MTGNSSFALIAQFMGRQNTIPVPVPFVRLVGDYTAAAFLAQVMYWSDRSTDQDGWFYKTGEEWTEEMLLTPKQLRRCVKDCGNLVEVERRGIPAKNYYRPVRENIVAALQGLQLEDEEVRVSQMLPKGTSRSDRRAQQEVTEGRSSRCPKVTASSTLEGTSNTKPTHKPTHNPQEREARAQKSGDDSSTAQGLPAASEASPSQVEPVANVGTQNSQTQVREKVPAGGADKVSTNVETEAFLRRKLSSQFVDRMLEEIQPLGVDRRVDWFALPLERAQELVEEAQRTHMAHKVKVPTRLRDLLDDECRRLSTPVRAQQAEQAEAERGEEYWLAGLDQSEEDTRGAEYWLAGINQPGGI